MSPTSSSDAALLVLVSGPPGAGKSTIARELAPRLRLPLIAKDDIKESLSDSLDRTSLRWSKRLGAATFDLLFVLMERFVSNGASAIFESNFYPKVHRERLRTLQSRHPFVPFEVYCTADVAILADRTASRERHAVHHRLSPSAGMGGNGPLELDGACVRVDTGASEDVDLDRIVAEIEGIRDGF